MIRFLFAALLALAALPARAQTVPNSLVGPAYTTAGCTVGVASAQCLAAATASRTLLVQNTSGTAQVACSFGGTAALNAAGSFMLQPGQSASWGYGVNGVPAGALNCIASAGSTPLFIFYN